jgi:hypothetical protein
MGGRRGEDDDGGREMKNSTKEAYMQQLEAKRLRENCVD